MIVALMALQFFNELHVKMLAVMESGQPVEFRLVLDFIERKRILQSQTEMFDHGVENFHLIPAEHDGFCREHDHATETDATRTHRHDDNTPLCRSRGRYELGFFHLEQADRVVCYGTFRDGGGFFQQKIDPFVLDFVVHGLGNKNFRLDFFVLRLRTPHGRNAAGARE